MIGEFVKYQTLRATVTREIADKRDITPVQEALDQMFENRLESAAVEDADIAAYSMFAWELEGGGWAKNFESAMFSTCHVSEVLNVPNRAHPGPPVSVHLHT